MLTKLLNLPPDEVYALRYFLKKEKGYAMMFRFGAILGLIEPKDLTNG